MYKNEDILDSYEVELLDDPKDRDCLFYSIASYVQQQHHPDSVPFINCLQCRIHMIYKLTRTSGNFLSLTVCTKAPQLVSHLMIILYYIQLYMVYMRADAEQYNYKMYRWRSTYLAAANNYKQYTAYSTELNGARGVRATSCSRQ